MHLHPIQSIGHQVDLIKLNIIHVYFEFKWRTLIQRTQSQFFGENKLNRIKKKQSDFILIMMASLLFKTDRGGLPQESMIVLSQALFI